ncbi:hypothetical protein REC12_16545 [Desulfosporosinus sp. PR]|nr:hypothetical protein [Desulfosporosinus sp. PR]
MFSNEYTIGWREFTGGYNKKAMLSVIVCLLLCITPLWPLPLLPLIPALIWFITDTSIKVLKYNKTLKANRINDKNHPDLLGKQDHLNLRKNGGQDSPIQKTEKSLMDIKIAKKEDD